MRLTLHILKKDLRRLWPAIAITMAMLVMLGHADSWRADRFSSDREGWLNLLLPVAWACVIALAVLQEPLIGDRHFWQTRPYRWPSLLAAKLAFAVIAVHIPLLLCDLYILNARDFSPTADLFWKQALLAVLLTLPSIALAVLVRNFTHFILALFAIAIVFLFTIAMQVMPDYTRQSQQLRHAILFATITLGAAAIALIQYARRKPLLARTLAVATAATAIGVSSYLPIQAEYRTANRERVVSREATRDPILFQASRWPRLRTVLLPITVEPAGGDPFRVPFVKVQVHTPSGVRIESSRPSPTRPFDRIPLIAHPYGTDEDGTPAWLMLTFSTEAWNLVKDGPVRIKGDAGLAYYRLGNITPLPPDIQTTIPGVGRCVSSQIETPHGEPMLKVFCEQPGSVPHCRVQLLHPPSDRLWRQALNASMLMTVAPNRTWLSPIDRAQTFFHLATPEQPATSPSPYIVPAEVLPDARVEITPEIPTGSALVPFELPNIQLTNWLVQR